MASKATVPLTDRPSNPRRASVPVTLIAKPLLGLLMNASEALRINRPMASGLVEPSSSLDGPLPTKISRPVPLKLPLPMLN